MKSIIIALYAIVLAVGTLQISTARPATHSVSASPLETCEVLEAYFAHYEARRNEKFAKLPALKDKVQVFWYIEPQTAWFTSESEGHKSNSKYSFGPGSADVEITHAGMVEHRKHVGARIERRNKFVASFNEAHSDDEKIKPMAPIHDDTFGAYRRAQSHVIGLSKCNFGANIHMDSASLKVLNKLKVAGIKYNQENRNAYKQARRTSKAHRRKTGENLNVGEIKEGLTAHLVRPQGYRTMKFSAVGINFERGQAMFYTEYYCGSLCAGGNYIFMKREHGKWVYNGSVMVWVS